MHEHTILGESDIQERSATRPKETVCDDSNAPNNKKKNSHHH